MRVGIWPLAGVFADVAGPSGPAPGVPGPIAPLSLAVWIGFGVLVAITAGVSILVIRAVKKNRAPKDQS